MNPPEFIYVHINKRCNQRCLHCDFWKENDNDKADFLRGERMRDLLEEYAEMNPSGKVVVCGGEMLLDMDDYFFVTTTCRELGLRAYFATNGSLINENSIAERLILEGAHEISVSLDSHLPALHDELRGSAGSFEKAVKAIRLLLEARERLKARDTRIYIMGLIHESNYLDLEDFYEFVLNDLKADKLKLNFLQPTFGRKEPADNFFAKNSNVDPDVLAGIIDKCDKRFQLGLNPVWLEQVRMYFTSLRESRDLYRGWSASSETKEHICNSYERNIMVDHYGVMRLCFSVKFPGVKISQKGDLKKFWESSDPLREEMRGCNQFCGISHSVRRETATIASRRKISGETLRVADALLPKKSGSTEIRSKLLSIFDVR